MLATPGRLALHPVTVTVADQVYVTFLLLFPASDSFFCVFLPKLRGKQFIQFEVVTGLHTKLFFVAVVHSVQSQTIQAAILFS